LIVSLLQTAQKYGADCKNYQEVEEFLYKDNKIAGVKVKDSINNTKFDVFAPMIVNATGAFSDIIRALDDKQAKQMLDLSSGVHIVLDKKYLPSKEGLMIPKTEDGRVLFILPWMGKCLVGTTDEPTKLATHPKVATHDVEYLLKHLELYFDLKITKKDILSSWCGIRPLVTPDEDASTSSIVREHLISQSDSGLISIIGGKWTTYRKMAEQTVDFALSQHNTEAQKCKTKKFKLLGSKNLDNIPQNSMVDEATFKHLVHMYGDRANEVLKCSLDVEKLHPRYDYISAEVSYCIQNEFVQKPLDFLIRRSSLGLIDKEAAKEMLDKVLELMANELHWSDEKTAKEREDALKVLTTSI